MKTKSTHGGKGSTRRPTDHQRYGDNYDRIFGKHKPTDAPQAQPKVNVGTKGHIDHGD